MGARPRGLRHRSRRPRGADLQIAPRELEGRWGGPPAHRAVSGMIVRLSPGPAMTSFVTLLDFIGTFAFAISGGLVAVRHRLDLFGMLVLAFAAATAGGMTRDVVLGVRSEERREGKECRSRWGPDR